MWKETAPSACRPYPCYWDLGEQLDDTAFSGIAFCAHSHWRNVGMGAVERAVAWLSGTLGRYVGWLMLKRPEALTFESNHISWKHMYLLLMAGHVGFVCVFAIG